MTFGAVLGTATPCATTPCRRAVASIASADRALNAAVAPTPGFPAPSLVGAES